MFQLARIAQVAIIAVGLAAPAQADTVTVFAAASLKEALDDVAARFAAVTDHTAVASYAGSSELARQIEAGAPADVFISASPEWMDAIETAGLVAPATRQNLLTNRLVLVAHDPAAPQQAIGPGFDLAGLLGDGRLAMALVGSVPAGIYGRAALTSLGAWDKVASRVAQSDNVRAALRLVAIGEAPYGIVYATDAVAEPRVTVAGTFPASSHPPILYPAALIGEAPSEAARAYLAFLSSDAAREAFEGQGFGIAE